MPPPAEVCALCSKVYCSTLPQTGALWNNCWPLPSLEAVVVAVWMDRKQTSGNFLINSQKFHILCSPGYHGFLWWMVLSVPLMCCRICFAATSVWVFWCNHHLIFQCDFQCCFTVITPAYACEKVVSEYHWNDNSNSVYTAWYAQFKRRLWHISLPRQCDWHK